MPKGVYPRQDPQERFWSQVGKTQGGCWYWLGGVGSRGYGIFSVKHKSVMAHRWIYEQTQGKIPAGQVIDHLCTNTVCVNPYHLEAVSNRENVLRGGIPGHKLTHCVNGHEYTPENTKRNSTHGRRMCRQCTNEKQNERRYKRYHSDAVFRANLRATNNASRRRCKGVTQ